MPKLRNVHTTTNSVRNISPTKRISTLIQGEKDVSPCKINAKAHTNLEWIVWNRLGHLGNVLPQAATLADDEPSCIVREVDGESKVNIIVLYGPSLCASFYEVGIGVVACVFLK